MGGGALDTPAVGGNVAFNCGGVIASCELFFLCLAAANNGDSEQFFIDSCIEFEDLEDFFSGELFCQMCCVSFLPQEFSSSKKGGCLFGFPSHNAVPLVEAERKVAVGANPLRVIGIHDCFRCGTDCDRNFEVFVSATHN
jgi:hypothetical protein